MIQNFVGGAFLALGLALIFFSLSNISHDPHEANSPFLWVFLLFGLIAAGLGAVLLML